MDPEYDPPAYGECRHRSSRPLCGLTPVLPPPDAAFLGEMMAAMDRAADNLALHRELAAKQQELLAKQHLLNELFQKLLTIKHEAVRLRLALMAKDREIVDLKVQLAHEKCTNDEERAALQPYRARLMAAVQYLQASVTEAQSLNATLESETDKPDDL